MKKTLYDLTKEDWNRLFPVELVDHDPEWKNVYEEERARIIKKIGNKRILRIEHFGSTSIPGIKSKPYIDLMIEVPKEILFDENLIAEFTELGYAHFKVPERGDIKAYSSFGKGYNLEGKSEQIYFRDYLNSNPERAGQYERLKIELAARFKDDRGAYVLGKTDFINETLDMIFGEYPK